MENEMITLNPLDKEQFDAMYPGGYDLDSAKKKGIVKTVINEEKYRICQAAYLQLLNAWLNSEIELDNYQKELDNSQYNYPSQSPDIFCENGLCGRKNIALRNNVFIERLSSEDLELLDSLINDNQVTINGEGINLIERTWRDVIEVFLGGEKSNAHMINYDMDAVNGTEAMSDSLTFEILFDSEFDENGNLVDEDYEAKKFAFVEKLSKKMEIEIATELDCNVKVFVKIGEVM